MLLVWGTKVQIMAKLGALVWHSLDVFHQGEYNMSEEKITMAVGSVMLANVHPHVAASLGVMLGKTGRLRPEMAVDIITPPRMEIATARNATIDIALARGHKYLFWLDDDTVCPPDTIVRLLERLEANPDVYMICPKYYVRGYPFKLMGFIERGPNDWEMIDEAKDLPDKDGLIRCVAIGNGCTLYRMSIFEQMVISRQGREWYRTGKGHTEDAFFCAKAKTVIPDFICAMDTTFSAKHQLGTGWVDAENVDYTRLKFQIAKALVHHPERLEELKALVSSWPEEDVYPLDIYDYDGSLGRV